MTIERTALINRLKSYEKAPIEIEHALKTLAESDTKFVTNEEIGDIWERVSKAIDKSFSDDTEHDAWKLEVELSNSYIRD